MRRVAIVLVMSVAVSRLALACSSSDSSGSASDASVEGATPFDASACVVAKVVEPQAGGCQQASDCTVRYTGEFCCTPEPQAMTSAASATYDQNKNDVGIECKQHCQTVRCGAKADAGVGCTNGICTLL